MFDSLSGRFEGIFGRLREKGRLGQEDVEATLRDVRMALLEADVNVAVVKSLLARIGERAVGAELIKSLSPAQLVIKVVHEELVRTLGDAASDLVRPSRPPMVVMVVGLQGSGKTTTAAKLAQRLQQTGTRPLLVAADLQRPAAIEQLEVLGRQIGVSVFREPSSGPIRLVK
ncbi:MAG TPA: signal recognition particle receptor subunit alpha, partial [Acidimicrobiia bacterium]